MIRTGGPSTPAQAKVAIVASERNLTGTGFTVVDGGKVVLRGHLKPAAGSAAPWAHAYQADLSALKQPGAFKVRAAGLTSRPWRIRAGGSSELIPLLLRYFRTQRDGNEPALLHRPSHLNDGVVKGGPHDGAKIDLTGGWMDAGDMIHFSQTTGFAAALLQAGARLDPANASALNEEADVGIRWLLKAHPFPDLFVVQVGGVVDHSRGFRDPASDDSSGVAGIATRIAYHWGAGVGGDIGGKVSAALALAAQREPNPGRRAQLIAAAADWYSAGKAAGRPTPSLPGTGGFYTYKAWKSSLAAGAAALFRVTGDATYLADALGFLRGSRGQRYELLEAANMAPFAAADICGALGAPPLGDAAARKQACRFLADGAGSPRDYVRQNAFAPASYFQWGTTGVNAAGGAQAALAASAGFGNGYKIAAGARDYLLGLNAWGASFVAGFGPHSPKHPHHWASVFPPHSGLPEGALVGGPAPRDQVTGEGFKPGGPLRAFNSDIVYEDRRGDYVTSEPAIDYSAAAILLLAALDAR